MPATLDSLINATEPARLATGFGFTEGPLWHPDGFFYFVDLRVEPTLLYRIVPGGQPEVVWSGTDGSNGTTFDMQGRLLLCQGGARRVIRRSDSGDVEVLADGIEVASDAPAAPGAPSAGLGVPPDLRVKKRLNRPNDIVCRSDGSIYFTDPAGRLPFPDREMPASVIRVAPDGAVSVVAECELPNGLAFSPDESILYVANTRIPYIHALDMNPDGTVRRRRIFADMSSGEGEGVPDGMKVDVEGNIYCTGAGGTWVFDAAGNHLGIIRTPELPANMAFGGPDMQTLFLTARTSVYTLRTKVPGLKHPWLAKS